MTYKTNGDERQRIMNQLADSVLELSDEEILAEVCERGADPQEEAGRTRSALQHSLHMFQALDKQLSSLGHVINSRSWRHDAGSYSNRCVNCGSLVRLTAATNELRGDALDESCAGRTQRAVRRTGSSS